MRKNKLIALLLTVCLAVGMMACGGDKPAESQQPSGDAPVSSEAPSTEPSKAPEKPYKGAKIQVYGMGKIQPDDISGIQGGVSTYMAAAAMIEWAHENEASIEFINSYTVDVLSAAVNGGVGPDLVSSYNTFPNYANIGLLGALNSEQKAKLAEACGGTTAYFDPFTYKGEVYGIGGPHVTYFNVITYNYTLFQEMGEKTPKEYWLEGTWDWKTFEEVCKKMTKDVDGDGKYDIYGSTRGSATFGSDSLVLKEAADGKLSIVFGQTQQSKDAVDMLYRGITEGWIVNPGKHLWTQMDYPRPAMYQLGLEMFNYTHLYKTLPNGNITETAPMPVYDLKDESTWGQVSGNSYFGFMKASDNLDATVDMVAFVMKCAAKWCSELSLGAIPCEFEGMKGTTAYSKKYLELFAEFMESEKKYWAGIEHLDKEYVAKMYDYVYKYPVITPRKYAGVSSPFAGSGSYKTIYTTPPATSIAELAPVLQGQLDAYNDLYVY